MSSRLIPADVPPFGDEQVPPEEAAATATILATLAATVREGAKTGAAQRDAHPKAHGCVKAEFRVLDDLPPALRIGLFAAPAMYQAYIRFSNGSPKRQPDHVADVRGMAVKVMGVAASPSTTQDFVMINGPAFFVRSALDYVAFTGADPQWRFFFPGLNPFHFRLREFLNVRAMLSERVSDPLDIRYWSAVPFLFGETAFKYSARPVDEPDPREAIASPDALRENLARRLATEGAAFDLLAQLRTRPDVMSIEDSTIEWRERDSPFVPVARITIAPQRFDSPDQLAFCENLSFTPWHGLPAHRPLGGINRVRRIIYEAISELRHALNEAPRQEPQGW